VSHERFTPADAGLVTALVTAGTTVSWPLAGLVSDRLGRRRPVYFVSQALGAAGCLGFAWIVPGAGFAASLAVAAFTGLALGGMVLPFVMLLDLVPPHRVGMASGLVNTCWLLGGMVAPAVLGRLVDASGSFVAAFGACAILALLPLPIAWLVPEAAPSA
jgi:MFS family permease